MSFPITPSALHPPFEPRRQELLRVSPVHEIWFEESGNPQGKPAVFLHGGPGAGTDGNSRRYFDPQRYRIVVFDQRGCGKSQPHASLEQNTTWDLVADIEKLRRHLGIEKWLVLGGSWGSTLALAYAQTHPERVSELVLRGIFTFLQDEMDWLLKLGMNQLFPDNWQQFLAPIPEAERDDLAAAYYRRLTGSDPEVQLAAARAWVAWECSALMPRQDPKIVEFIREPRFALAMGRLECHYFVNRGWLKPQTQLLDRASRIAGIPTKIVHGRYDVICPPASAWRLHRLLPRSELSFIDGAGHSGSDPLIAQALVAATNAFAGS
jgi:proline iminopeptidase